MSMDVANPISVYLPKKETTAIQTVLKSQDTSLYSQDSVATSTRLYNSLTDSINVDLRLEGKSESTVLVGSLTSVDGQQVIKGVWIRRLKELTSPTGEKSGYFYLNKV